VAAPGRSKKIALKGYADKHSAMTPTSPCSLAFTVAALVVLGLACDEVNVGDDHSGSPATGTSETGEDGGTAADESGDAGSAADGTAAGTTTDVGEVDETGGEPSCNGEGAGTRCEPQIQCAQTACEYDYKRTYGEHYTSGVVGGMCGTWVTCMIDCGCDSTCAMGCVITDVCEECLLRLTACMNTNCAEEKMMCS